MKKENNSSGKKEFLVENGFVLSIISSSPSDELKDK